MICQSCEKRPATTHIKTIVNGELKEFMLCPECAGRLGYGSLFTSFGPDLDSLFGGFMDSYTPKVSGKRCSFCGSSFEDIAQSGRVGCAHCYEVFEEELLPSLQRIHGRTSHTGKLAKSAGRAVKLQSEIEALRKDLENAIKTQEFEKAASIRDKIRELQKMATEQGEE